MYYYGTYNHTSTELTVERFMSTGAYSWNQTTGERDYSTAQLSTPFGDYGFEY